MSATRESVNISREQLLGMIDHSLLKPQLTRDEIVAGLEYAAEVRPKAICIVPNHLKLAAEILSGTDVLLGTVAGFPNGAMRTDVKVFESVKAVEDGATEVDMVIPIGALVGGEYDVVLADITEVVRAVAPAEVKVILETAYLTDEQILKGSVRGEEHRQESGKEDRRHFHPDGGDEAPERCGQSVGRRHARHPKRDVTQKSEGAAGQALAVRVGTGHRRSIEWPPLRFRHGQTGAEARRSAQFVALWVGECAGCRRSGICSPTRT